MAPGAEIPFEGHQGHVVSTAAPSAPQAQDMYGNSGVPWGTIHAKRRASEAESEAGRQRRGGNAWKQRALVIEEFVLAHADAVHPDHDPAVALTHCGCRACWATLLAKVRDDHPVT